MAHLYDSTVVEFVKLVNDGGIATLLQDRFVDVFEYNPSPNEVTSWANSLAALAQVLDTATLANVRLVFHVFLEYKMPLTSARADVILLGRGSDGKPKAVVIELKQWQAVKESAVRDHVSINNINHLHPSAQVRAYCEYLKYYHRAFTTDNFGIAGCAFLHNMTDHHSIKVLGDPALYGTLPAEYPVFFAKEGSALTHHLETQVGHGVSQNAVEALRTAAIAPSTKLLDVVDKAIQSNFEWRLLDSQLSVFDTVVSKVAEARVTGQKYALVVRGGPGTGKSVLAIQLLAYAARQRWRVAHATGSKAFIDVLKASTQGFADDFLKKVYNVKYKNQIPVGHIFSTFADIATIGAKGAQQLDLVVADEAHRLWDYRRRKFQGMNLVLSNTPMIEEVIAASRVTVLFLDDNQSVRSDEIGSVTYLVGELQRLGVAHDVMDLNVQFRCSGSSSYIEWIDHVLGYPAEQSLAWREFDGYDFQIVDSMADMQAKLDALRDQGNKARLVAGFCWRWSIPNGNGTLVHDVSDPRFGAWSAPWIEKTEQHAAPIDSRYTKWATDDTYYSQVGSIYSAQGFEFDYIGLIVGEDLVWRNGKWVADVSKNQDGVFKRDLKSSGSDAAEHLRNIYRVLLTRGMKGTFVFFLDQETRRHFEELLSGAWLPLARTADRLLLSRGSLGRVQDLRTGQLSAPELIEVLLAAGNWELLASARNARR